MTTTPLSPIQQKLNSTWTDKILSSLTASAQRIKTKKRGSGRTEVKRGEPWQEDAWDAYDLVGELRFLSTTLSNRMKQARFYVGEVPDNNTEDLTIVESGPAYDAFQTMEPGSSSFAEMVGRVGLHLFLPGESWLMGAPEYVAPDPSQPVNPRNAISPFGQPQETEPGDIDLDELEWRAYSQDELLVEDGKVTVNPQGTGGGVKTYQLDNVILIRVWRSHPRYSARCDSPTRSSLPVLRELIGLTMYVSAQTDSRLAGAGVLLVPASADQAMRQSAGTANDDRISPFAEALMDAMMTAVEDRASASALVPIMPVVPDESIEKFKHLLLAGALDPEARELREEALRRLALGLDCPPELLLGVANMNHWGAWLVREDVVTTHLAPPLQLFCDALTMVFLWPVLEQQGVENYKRFRISYAVDHLIQRPNKTQDAKDAHAAGVISDEAYRDALGFDETEAPDVDPTDPVIIMALDMLRQAPSLAQSPGISMLAEQIRAMLAGDVIPVVTQQEDPAATPAVPAADADVGGAEAPAEGGVPATADAPADNETGAPA